MWYPELAGRIRITLVEALPSVLPMFSKQLINYTESTFKESKIDILTKTMVKQVRRRSVSSERDVAHDPPRNVRQVIVRLNLSRHHSQTFPPTQHRSRAFGRKAETGAVRG